jgi:hypothetical protein
MRKLNDDEFVDFCTNGKLATILVKTASCPKCKILEKKIEDAGNLMDVFSYTITIPGDEVSKLIDSFDVMFVPFVVIAEKGSYTIFTDIGEIETHFANPNWAP